MHPSTATAGATAVQSKPQTPPSSENRVYQGDAALNSGGGPPSLKKGGPAANSPMSELAQLMEEPAGGANSGRRASTNPEVEGRHLPLGADEWQAAEFMRGGGWSVVTAHERGWTAGMSAHRGVVHPDEHVDREALQAMVESELGFSYEQVRSVYRQGPLSATQRELRAAIDARVLALSRSGANVALLGQALGFPIKDNGNVRAMENALSRARASEESN